MGDANDDNGDSHAGHGIWTMVEGDVYVNDVDHERRPSRMIHHLDIIESHAREGKHLEISLMAISKNADY